MRVAVAMGLLLLCAPAGAGVYHLADGPYEEFIVVHPQGYTGAGGAIDIKVCAAPGAEITLPALRQAVRIWDSLTPTTENCAGECRTHEQGAVDETLPFRMGAVLLHELGHCAMGLGHPNWLSTSYTNTVDVKSWIDGPDPFRGTRDDLPQPLPGSRLIHWFRTTDNDPVVIDGTVIDGMTFSRRILDLPSGHLWPANGNVATATLLGELNTQAVMYSAIPTALDYTGVTADEVATVRFGMSGLDEMAGTADDYTVSMTIVDDCDQADVEVTYESFPDPDNQPLADCLVDLEYIGPGGLFMIHHALKPFVTEQRARIQVNPAKLWDVVFADGFEAGDLSAWSPP